jgi:diguanylate cyclase (GGDEF)-like protein/putative nucleotidyltransferase with HDIG domain
MEMGPTLFVLVVAMALLAVVVHQRREIATLLLRLEEASRVDAVTGLLNRRAFEELLNLELDRSRRTNRPVSIIIGEIDGLGRLNTERGHAAGDTALQQVAGDMAKWKRRIDSAGRLGGEKFGVILPETDEDGAFLVAERLRRASRRTFAQDALPLTISFGVAGYPVHGDQFGVLMGAAVRAVHAAAELGRDRSVIYCPDLERMLAQAPDRAKAEPRIDDLIGLAEELDVRDAGVTGHSHAVGDYAELMARELEFPPEHVERVRLAGVLHDIGKTGVSDRLMSKRGPLDPDEWRSIRTHPEGGARLLAHPELEDLRAWVLAHHERPDGKGYPHGLVGDDVPIEARILAVADAYEAMTSDRPYRTTLGDGAAADELRAGAGTQFDAQVVDAFLSALARQEAPAALHQAS